MRALEGYCTTKGSRSLLSLWVLYWAKSCSKSSVRDSGQRPVTSLMALILKKNKQTECNINTMRLIFGFINVFILSSYPTVMTSPEFLSVTKLLAMVMMTGSMIYEKEYKCLARYSYFSYYQFFHPQLKIFTHLWRDELVGSLGRTQENFCHL